MGVRQLFDLSGQVALVTGASRGLGLQMAEALGEMGARLLINARKADELAATADHLCAQGAEVLAVAGDIASPGGVTTLVDAALAHYGVIDILVNNAGTNWSQPTEDYPDEAWRKVMALNVDALFALCREVGRRSMIPRQQGKIINIASVSGLMGNPVEAPAIAYNTSKGAVVNFTRALAVEWGHYNINVNALCPGFFPSRMSQGLLERIEPQVAAATPLRRIGGPEDLKGPLVFLASEASRHVTGQYLVVDGGRWVAG
jgi:NAD(P)-dependent dehydrogenase (short-subunit alcohol dehydrogenase family)